jgi:MFS family permease
MASTRTVPAGRASYLIIQVAFGVALIGNGIGGVAYPLFVLEVTGNIGLTGAVVTAGVVGAILMGLVMGPVLDRWSLRRSWIASVLTSAGITVLTVSLYAAGSLPPWLLLVLAFIRSAADEPGRVASFGMLPAVAVRSGHTLERANATLRGMSSLATLLGPAAAGAAVGLFGSPVTLLAESVALIAAAVIMMMFQAIEDLPEQHAEKTSYRERFRGALRFLWQERVLRALLVATMVFAALDTGLATIGLTAYSAENLGAPAWYGALVSAFGVGALTGTICYGIFGHRLPHRIMYLAAYLALAVLLLLLIAPVGVAGALALLALAGFVISPVDLIYMQALQERVPSGMFGSVTSIAGTVVSSASPAGVALITWLVATNGSRRAFVVLSFCYFGITLVLFFVRALRELRPRQG